MNCYETKCHSSKSKPRQDLVIWPYSKDLSERWKQSVMHFRWIVTVSEHKFITPPIEQSLLPSSAWQSPPVVTSPSDANLPSDADATTWVSGGSIYEQSSLLIADCASPPSFPVQAIGPNQPSLLIKPHTSLTATPYNVATYPIVSSDPQSQTIFFVSQPEPYTQECQSANGTTTVGLYRNHE
ncbi:hypothetical protein PspLS_11107 [Pyricularia sp. CBS 133598]|nr:hypothetical protein PspLS_11107 [Pyricularia sp. CBS 133598]